MATIYFSSGDIGLYQAVWNGPAPWSVTVSTPTARYEMRPLERLTVQPRGSRVAAEVARPAADIDFKPGLQVQAEHTLKALQGLPHSLPDLDTSLRSMRLVAVIYGLSQPTFPL
jgi:hypothetical protein